MQLSDAALGDFVLFIHPRINRPDEPGATEWVLIAGARGCTAESCGFRDLADDFQTLGLSIYGLSTQDSADQLEAAERLHLTYPLSSDPELERGRALGLSTFHVEGRDLYRRSTLVVHRGSIVAAQLEVAMAPRTPTSSWHSSVAVPIADPSVSGTTEVPRRSSTPSAPTF